MSNNLLGGDGFKYSLNVHPSKLGKVNPFWSIFFKGVGQNHQLVSDSTSELGVSTNNGTPKSSILIGFSIINHPFWGTPIFRNIQFN